MRVSKKTSPYVHDIKVLSTTAGYGIALDQGKRSFGATGLPEILTSAKKEEKWGGVEK
jgi:hypothetical protein